jgi:hypothetical protein
VSKRDDLVAHRLALLNVVYGPQCCHFPLIGHAAQAVQLADEGQGDGMVDKVVAKDAAVAEGQQMAVKCPDDGNKVAAVLHRIGIIGGLLLDRIGTIGNGGSAWHGCFSWRRFFPAKSPFVINVGVFALDPTQVGFGHSARDVADNLGQECRSL